MSNGADKHECKCQHGSGHHGNGFALGMMVGGAIVFLTTTDKGRRILKELSEVGMKAASEIKDLKHMDELSKVQEEMIESEPISRPEAPVKTEPKSGPIRKFFKGAKKR